MIDTQAVVRSYRRWAPVYDIVFGKLFAGPRAEAADAARRVGGRMLEVGVGNGIALASYKPPLRVVGIDVSREMLARARKRVAALGRACPSSNHLRPLWALANGVSGPSVVKVKRPFGDASSGGAGWCCA